MVVESAVEPIKEHSKMASCSATTDLQGRKDIHFVIMEERGTSVANWWLILQTESKEQNRKIRPVKNQKLVWNAPVNH